MIFNYDSKINPAIPAYVTQLGKILTSFTHLNRFFACYHHNNTTNEQYHTYDW